MLPWRAVRLWPLLHWMLRRLRGGVKQRCEAGCIGGAWRCVRNGAVRWLLLLLRRRLHCRAARWTTRHRSPGSSAGCVLRMHGRHAAHLINRPMHTCTLCLLMHPAPPPGVSHPDSTSGRAADLRIPMNCNLRCIAKRQKARANPRTGASRWHCRASVQPRLRSAQRGSGWTVPRAQLAVAAWRATAAPVRLRQAGTGQRAPEGRDGMRACLCVPWHRQPALLRLLCASAAHQQRGTAR